jgi:hypothetical protein
MRASINLLFVLCLAGVVLCLAGVASADPRVESGEPERPGFDELVLTIDFLGVGASTVSGPTRRTLRVRADGRMQLERSHPLLHFPTCRGRATRTEVDRLARLLPSKLPGTVGPTFTRPDPEGRSSFRLARKRGESFDGAEGLVSALEAAELTPLAGVLEGLARRLIATRGCAESQLQGRVVVRPLSGRFEVLVATESGEVTVAEPLASALRALKGYPVVVSGDLGVEGALQRARLLDPRPVRLRGEATRLGAKPGLRLRRGHALQAIGPRRSVLAAAHGHRVQVSGWRFRSGLLLIDSVGAQANEASTARRRQAEVAKHSSEDALRVLHVSRTRGLALVQASRGGRIGWIPSSKLRWSERAQLPPPEGSRSLSDALDFGKQK